MLERVSNYSALCFRDIMVGTCHNPESSGAGDDEIRRMIHKEVVAAIREAIPEMFKSIKTNLIETFDEHYAAVTEAAVVAATTVVAVVRPQGSDSLLYRSSATRSHQSLMGLRIRFPR